MSGTAADSGGIANVKFSLQQGSGNYWNGAGFASAIEVLQPASGTTSWSAPFAFANFPADGAYTLRVKATDTAGNTESTSVSTFTIDTTAPIVSLLTPANGSSSNTTPLFSGVAGILTGDATTVTVRIYSGPTATGAALQTLITARDGAGAYSVAAAALPEGIYTAQTTQTDSAGNTGLSTANTFTVDTTAPVVSLLTPANNSFISDTTPAFSGVAGILTGDSASVTVKIYSGSDTTGALVQTLNTTRGAGGAYSVDAAALAEGMYTAQSTQADSAGNSGSSSANTFTVDTTAPVVSLTSPANGSFISDTTPTFSGVAGILAGDNASVTSEDLHRHRHNRCCAADTRHTSGRRWRIQRHLCGTGGRHLHRANDPDRLRWQHRLEHRQHVHHRYDASGGVAGNSGERIVDQRRDARLQRRGGNPGRGQREYHRQDLPGHGHNRRSVANTRDTA